MAGSFRAVRPSHEMTEAIPHTAAVLRQEGKFEFFWKDIVLERQ